MTYSVTVRDHIMIAHSLSGEIFGPAQRLHGATYVVDATFRAADLDDDGVVVDIGRASDALRGILASLSYRNLDELAEFAGLNTTTERLCSVIADRLVAAARDGGIGPGAARLHAIAVTLHESHIAWASYEVTL
ncbi:6-pyruvoyl-tetrahydropterin synthase [Microbacterium sp. cf046]|uniref:6-pyruvoyl trahydropterin synthase family protein n=1 Tax=Microbacterium sp. cf046 TaxID=1761803 RepID=UPI0008E4070C|nr:6-carboxytetrahydropterin synthase [Microbacterium sp. cf046]SFS14679.1 6-pyruvoyl-tetrahydropterin synthase [Microbacterium sp. cf046]